MASNENKYAIFPGIHLSHLSNELCSSLGAIVGENNIAIFDDTQAILENFEFRPLQGVILLGVLESPFIGLNAKGYEGQVKWRQGIVNALMDLAHLAPPRVAHLGVDQNKPKIIWEAVNGRYPADIKFMPFSVKSTDTHSSHAFVNTLSIFTG